jgi:enamine deaminase RidA (YjgF/YER057c/UK114 family)
MMTSPADAQTRPAVEHFGNPALNGKPLPFSEAVRVGDVLYLSGQIGIGADGKLPDGIEAQTKQAMDNIGAVLKRAGLTYADVFHCTAFPRRHEGLAGVQHGVRALLSGREDASAQRLRRERPRAGRASRDRMPGVRGEEIVPHLAAYFGIDIGT